MTEAVQTQPMPLTDRRGRGSALWGLVVAVRPRQWVKNVLVGAAPLAAGELSDVSVAAKTVFAFAIFCLAASSIYLFNDVVDIERDRHHPRKMHRPIASGLVPVPLAVVAAGVLSVTACVLPSLTGSPRLGLTVAVYIALNLAYNLGLKHERVLDISIVSSGFLLRAIAGGVAADLPLSRWFLIVAAFGSMFIVAGKRYSELVTLGDQAAMTRPSLVGYSASYLRFVWSIAAAVTITGYCLWAFEVGDTGGDIPWGPISVAPFVVGMLRFALDVDGGRAGAPEEIAMSDRVLIAVGVIWLVVFSLGAFHG
jgi:decaprenyl-phosphate phosphoribosyltransferase